MLGRAQAANWRAETLAGAETFARRETLAFDLAWACVIILGLAWCYTVNRRGDGRHFVERFTLLSVPVSVGTYALFYVLYLACGLLAYSTDQLAHWPRTLATAISSLVALTASYWWLGRLMARAAGQRTT